jgi:SAM-dependent methyltransferase
VRAAPAAPVSEGLNALAMLDIASVRWCDHPFGDMPPHVSAVFGPWPMPQASQRRPLRLALHRLVNLPFVRRAVTERRIIARAYFEYIFLRENPYRSPNKREKIDTAYGLVAGLKVARALEIGCGEGRWTHRLAAIADEVVGTDIAWNAIRKARRRHRHEGRIRFRVADLLGDPLPEPPFDLVVCSEVLYYFRRDQLTVVSDRVVDLVHPSGLLLLVHERSLRDDDAGMSMKEFGARTVHDALSAHPALCVEGDVERPTFRATLLRRSAAH